MAAGDHIFVSVGTTATEEQEAFVCSVEARLRAEGLVPHTVGRDTFSSDAPLKTITDLMKRCTGVIVIALERTYFPAGFDRPGGSQQTPLAEVRLATPWNQIEAAMAYASGLPLLVIVQTGVKREGLLEPGYDWYVQQTPLAASSLATVEFNGVLASWKQKLKEGRPSAEPAASKSIDAGQMTIGQMLSSFKAAQLWAVLTAIVTMVVGAFSLGAYLFSKH